MSDWHQGDEDGWPVRFPVETPSQEASGRRQEHASPRWTGTEPVDTSKVQKRLAWLLLAAEIGMALVAACVLPLVFLNLPVREEGFLGAVGTKVGGWLGVSSQVACLIVALPIPILIVTLGANWWWFGRMKKKARQTEDQASNRKGQA